MSQSECPVPLPFQWWVWEEGEECPSALGFPPSNLQGQREGDKDGWEKVTASASRGDRLPSRTKCFFSFSTCPIPDLYTINYHATLGVCNKFAIDFRCWANSDISLFLSKIKLSHAWTQCEIPSSFWSNLLLITLGNWNLSHIHGAHIYPGQFDFLCGKVLKKSMHFPSCLAALGIGPDEAVRRSVSQRQQGSDASMKPDLSPLKKPWLLGPFGKPFISQFMKSPRQSNKSRPFGWMEGLYWFFLVIFYFGQTYGVLLEK